MDSKGLWSHWGDESAAELIVVFAGLVHAWLTADAEGTESRRAHLRALGFEITISAAAPSGGNEPRDSRTEARS